MSDKLKMVSEKEAYKLVMEALNLGEDEKPDSGTLAEFASELGYQIVPDEAVEEQKPEQLVVIEDEEAIKPVAEEVSATTETPAEKEEPAPAEESEEAPVETEEAAETVEEPEAPAPAETDEEEAEEPEEETEEVEEPEEETEESEEEEEVEEEESEKEPSEEPSETEATEEAAAPTEAAAPAEEADKKQPFTLTPPENNEELLEKMCTKRGRKLIYAPKEVLFEGTFTVLGTDKKNEEGIKVKDIIDALIKAGEKIGYLQKYDGLKGSEIKEEYENDVVYEYAEQEFKKAGLIYDGKKIKVYVYDWDGKACHHVGYIDETEAAGAIPYLTARDDYSFGLNAIITGGKGKKVTKDEKTGKITVEKIKDGVIGLEMDVNVLKRKD